MRSLGNARPIGRLTVLMALLALCLGLLTATGASPAFASDSYNCGPSTSYSTCTNVGYTDHGYGANGYGSMWWHSYTGHNCTNYVAYVEVQNGFASQNTYTPGNAYQWKSYFVGQGFTANGTPAVGSVAWWDQNEGNATGDGHVAYVESVQYDSNGSVSSVTISEDDVGSVSGFAWETISVGDSNWPGAFIHLKDITPNPPELLQSSVRTLPGKYTTSGDQGFAYATPDGSGTDIAVWTASTSGLAWQGEWYHDPNLSFATTVFIPADFNNSGLTSLYYATPDSGGGFTVGLLENTGSSFEYAGSQWVDTSLSLSTTEFISGYFSSSTDEGFAYVTPDGSGVNIGIMQPNGTTDLTYEGTWFYDTAIPMATTVFIPDDFNDSGYTSLYYATPDSGGGFTVGLLKNTGSYPLQYEGGQWTTSSLSLSSTEFIPGNEMSGGDQGFAYVTPDGSGVNIGVMQPNGTTSLTWEGTWFYDTAIPMATTVFVPADFNGDGLTDLFYATPSSGGGFDMSLLENMGSQSAGGFSYVSSQWNPTNISLSSTEFMPQN